MTTVYDQVRYPNRPSARSHPGHIGAIARLLGFEIAPLQNCRVLEIGCGEGVNIANLAIGAPGSEFVGFDLAASAIAHGRMLVDSAGLSNVHLRVADLRDSGAAPGLFDYIIAHGVYGWIPDDARAALMGLIGAKLSPRGVAFVSYNAFPGCRDRQTLRDFLRFSVRGYDDPTERIAIAREGLEFQIASWDETDAAQKALTEAARRKFDHPMEVLFHDEMGEHWAPQFLFDVVEAARAHGLDYLADAKPDELRDAIFPSSRFDAALPNTGGDWARFCQFEDFVSLRRFRWSLFRRAGAAPPLVATPDRLNGLFAGGELSPAPATTAKTFAFSDASGEVFETNDAKLGVICARIADGEAVPLDAFAEDAELANALLRLYVDGALTLSSEPPLFAREICQKPCASPLARAQASIGERALANLQHKSVWLEDPFWSQFLPRVDGTKTQDALAAFLVEATGRSFDEARGLVAGALTALASLKLLLADDATALRRNF